MTAVARKTLLLDLDNTLVLTTITYNGDVFGDLNFKLLEEDGSYSEYCVVFRHYVQEFIRRCQIFYNVGIFTAAERDYADRILDVLCPDVRLRFYSEDCKEGGHVKDLTALRGIEFDPTSFLLFDDRAPDNTIPHENGMCCPSFMHSEEQEHALQIFADVLCDERFHGVPDIRVPLSKYEQVRQNRMKSQQPNRTW
ncbi:NLI interacting factor-like phosphatase, putative [Angomonas deanei]|uniref:Mitochondrial import inner membrane translocase subunit TIM50 n=1 Tax=Angomonas deanei TaxID=59799 RepID=A0A7G2C9M7_9TRYP|nr:NLI interacting factor-like phosphatase, putative [Angomonas deanei]